MSLCSRAARVSAGFQGGGETIGKPASHGARMRVRFRADFEAAARLAAGSTVIAPVHASKCEPREAEKGKGDYCADLVHRLQF